MERKAMKNDKAFFAHRPFKRNTHPFNLILPAHPTITSYSPWCNILTYPLSMAELISIPANRTSDTTIPVTVSPSKLTPSHAPSDSQAVVTLGITSVKSGDAESTTALNSACNFRLRQFRYNMSGDLLMLKGLNVSDAHVLQHGQTTAKYQEAINMLLQAAPSES